MREPHVTPLTAFLPVMGEPGALHRALRQDPATWLPGGTPVGEDRWRMHVRGAGISRTVSARVGDPWRSGSTLWRALSWEPLGQPDDPEQRSRLLPSLDGELGLHAPSGGTASLVLDARYRPPGGHLGVALDTLALYRVAQNTVDRLLADIAARLAATADADVWAGAPGSST